MPLLFLQFPRWVCVLALLMSCLAGGLADSLGSTPAEILRDMPARFLTRLGTIPGKDGLVGRNREGFQAAALQRGATVTLAIAAARGDEKLADRCWPAVEVTFAHQTPEGSFGDPAESVAFWLCELTRTLLVIQESPLANHFHERIEALKSKLAKAALWLRGEQERLQREDRAAPNRLFFDAEAFLFCGQLLGDSGFQEIGRDFLARGMRLFRAEDGVFLEHNGGDSSYQAVNLLRLQEIVLRFPDKRVDEAIAAGVRWELSRIDAEGGVSTAGNTRVYPGGEKFLGKEKQVNVGEITLALLYYYARTGDAAALEAVERLQRHYAPPVR